MKKIFILFSLLNILIYGNEITEPLKYENEKVKIINQKVNISCPDDTCIGIKNMQVLFSDTVKLKGKVGIETIGKESSRKKTKAILSGDVDIDAPIAFKIGNNSRISLKKSKDKEAGKVNIKGDILIGERGELSLSLLKKGSSYKGNIIGAKRSKININLNESTMKSIIIQSGVLGQSGPEINIDLDKSEFTGKFLIKRSDDTLENQTNVKMKLNNSTLNLLEPNKRINIQELEIKNDSVVNLWDTKNDEKCCTKCKCSICKKCIISLNDRKNLTIGELSGNKGTFNMDITKQEIFANTNYKKDNVTIKINQKHSSIPKIVDYLLDPSEKDFKGKLHFAATSDNVKFISEYNGEAGSIKEYKLILENKDNLWFVTDVLDREASIVTDFKDDGATLYNLSLARFETDTLYQRMGELNLEKHKTGVWAKGSIGKNRECNTFYLIQGGIDRKIQPNLILGLSLSNKYNDTRYKHGRGYSNNFSLLGYLTYLNKEKENYLDLIAKYSIIKNEYNLKFATFDDNAKYSMNAFGLGIEAGKKFKVSENLSIVPLIQGTYTHINDNTYETKRGIKVNVDATKSFIGKLGLNLGYKTHYIKLGVLHEFLGNVKYNAVDKNNVIRKFEDINKGTWFSLGIGGTFNINEKSYIYYDFEKTFSNCKYNKWQISLGYRYEF